MCPPRWLRPGSLGGTLGEPGERRAGAHTPGAIPGSCAGVHPTPRDFTPTRLTTALCWCPWPLTSARLPAPGRGWDGVVLASQMELVSVILQPNGSPELCLSEGGGDWQELGGGFHPLPLLAQDTWLFNRYV